MHRKCSKNHSGKSRRFLLGRHRYLGVTKSFVRTCMTIQASGDRKRVAALPEHMVILDSARTHQKGISKAAVNAARLLCSERFRGLGRSARCAGWIVRGLHGRAFVAVFSLFPTSSAECERSAHSADDADIAFRFRSDDRDVLLSHVLLHFDIYRAFPFLFRVPKPLMEPGIVPAFIFHRP